MSEYPNEGGYPPPPYGGQQPYPQSQGHPQPGNPQQPYPQQGYPQGQGYEGQFGASMGGYPGGQFGLPPQYGAPQAPSMWARLGARILDGLIFALPVGVLSFILALNSKNTFSLTTGSPMSSFGSSFRASFTGPRIALSILAFIAFAAYQILMIARTGSTLGKRATGLRVVSDDGRPVTMRQSVIRWAVYSGPTIIPFVGSLWALLAALSPFFDSPRRQGFHDKAAHTLVVQR